MIRSRRLFGLVAMLCLFGFTVQIGLAGLASAVEKAGRPMSTVAQSYRQGPLETRDSVTFPDLPPGAQELLGLSVLAAVLYGLRASGLARESERSRRLHGR